MFDRRRIVLAIFLQSWRRWMICRYQYTRFTQFTQHQRLKISSTPPSVINWNNNDLAVFHFHSISSLQLLKLAVNIRGLRSPRCHGVEWCSTASAMETNNTRNISLTELPPTSPITSSAPSGHQKSPAFPKLKRKKCSLMGCHGSWPPAWGSLKLGMFCGCRDWHTPVLHLENLLLAVPQCPNARSELGGSFRWQQIIQMEKKRCNYTTLSLLWRFLWPFWVSWRGGVDGASTSLPARSKQQDLRFAS